MRVDFIRKVLATRKARRGIPYPSRTPQPDRCHEDQRTGLSTNAKSNVVALPTAVLAFTAGVWAQGALHPKQAVAAGAPLTISPLELQRNMKPDDLPVQYMKGDFN